MLSDFTWLDGLGVVGSLMLCLAYWMVTRGMLNPEGWRYNATNLSGSALLLISLYFKPNVGAVVIEVLWAAIAITALLRLFRSRRRSEDPPISGS